MSSSTSKSNTGVCSYKPLGVNDFRILLILPGQGDDVMRIRVEHRNFNEPPPYNALSYCWGSDNVKFPIVLEYDGANYDIQLNQSLAQALRQLRESNQQVVIWADQLCIRQDDDLEKASQVRLMSKIFGKATQVIVWTGIEDEHTKTVFNVLDLTFEKYLDVFKKAHVPGSEMTPAEISQSIMDNRIMLNEDQWTAIRKWFERPWFSRMWCFQELALARQAIVVCGDYFVRWPHLHTVCVALNLWDEHIPFDQSMTQRSYAKMMALMSCSYALLRNYKVDERAERIAGELLRLSTLVRTTRQRQSKLPHDKIYALLGIVQGIDLAHFPVDYKQHFNVTFCEATKHIIELDADLAVLKMVSLGKEEPQILPSWTPDYRYEDHAFHNIRNANAAPMTLHGHNRMYNATGLSKACPVSTGDKMLLGVKAILIGTIAVVSDTNKNYSRENLICQTVQTGGSWHQLAATCAVDGIYPATAEPIDLAYARLRVNDILSDERDAEARRARQRPIYSIPEPILDPYKNPEHDKVRGDITVCILRATTKQRLFISDNGYMGVAHESCVVGDAVYLAPGADMPIILRKLPMDRFRFIGETYVHGIMDGEYLLTNYKNQDKSATGMSDAEWLSSLENGRFAFSTETVVMA